MRPVVAIPGVLAIVVVLLVSYFGSPQVIASGTTAPQGSGSVQGAAGSVAYPTQGLTFTGGIPVTLTYSNLQPSGRISFWVCALSTPVSRCATGSHTVTATKPSGSLTFTLGSGEKIEMVSTSPGVAFVARSPGFALYSEVLVIVALAGLAVMIVGLILNPAAKKGSIRKEPASSPPGTPYGAAPPRPRAPVKPRNPQPAEPSSPAPWAPVEPAQPGAEPSSEPEPWAEG